MDVSFDLTTIPATRDQRRTAALTGLGILAIALAVIPVVRVKLGAFDGFVPLVSGALIVMNGIFATLLLRDSVVSRRPALLGLGAGFAFTGTLIVPYVLCFSGVIEWQAWHPAKAVSTWLWFLWHLGVPVGIIGAAILQRSSMVATPRRSRVVALGAPALALAIAAAVIVFSNDLPAVAAENGNWTRTFLVVAIATMTVVSLTAIAMIAARGFVTMLELWLAVAAGALLLDVLVSLSGGARFSVGWYVSKIDTLVGSGAVLVAMLSARMRLTAIVREGNKRLRAVVDGVADALVTLDDRHLVASFNPAAQRMFGYAPDEAVGLPASALIPAFGEELAAHIGAAPIEAQGRHRDGSTFPIEIAFGAHDLGTMQVTILIARDITQRKRVEAAIQAARDRAIEAAEVKAQFLATMSHEIRTPVNAVIGMSELLLQCELAEEPRDYAQTVRDSAEALLAVINDVLDFSQIEAGKLDIDAAAFSPLAVVEDAADICAATARKKGLAVITHISPDVPERAVGDARRIRQILLNLVGNAVKFTDTGSVVVRAIVDHHEGERIAIRFAVADTGPGIAPAETEKLFEAFHQADGSAHRRHGGSGLGLSISKRLVELMGGAIGVESVEGRGSTFWFTLVFEQLEENTDEAERPRPLRGKRMLILDEDETSRAMLDQYLLNWGVVGTSTGKPAHALALLRAAALRNAPFDAVIVDHVAGSIDAFAVAEQIRGDASIAGTSLIMVSGHDEPGRGADAIARGFLAYLRKPLRRATIFDALESAVDKERIPALPVVRSAVPAAAGRDGIVVLVAEDNVVNRTLALRQLKKLGYRAHAVADGGEAVEAAAREQYDVILMDCQMPEVDGFAATREIRKAELLRGTHVPILAMTANALDGDREACLAAGMDDYLIKPVQLAELRAALERYTTGVVRAG